jgi:16S rRNA (guanine527-N7)-methyltransferase
VIPALERLSKGASRILGRALDQRELEAFGKYLSLLRKWQRVHRLVGSAEPEWVVDNLFLDSLLFLRVLPREAISVADLGSGAGFPGIPIKIVKAELDMALIEARERRVSFLNAVIRETNLSGTRVFSGRAEDLSLTGLFEAVLMRCAGSIDRVLQSAKNLVVPGGRVIVAGPPAVHDIGPGEWLEVEGVRPGSIRRFAVYTVR